MFTTGTGVCSALMIYTGSEVEISGWRQKKIQDVGDITNCTRLENRTEFTTPASVKM